MIKDVTKKNVILVFIKSVFVLFIALTFWLPNNFIFGNFELYKFLLGLFICYITFFLIFPNFKKNKNIVKFLFFIETFVFILISLILISHFYIPKDGILFKISDLSHIICLVCIIHSITKLYVETILDDKNSILSFLTFIFYICLLSSSFYLLGAGTDLEKVIRYVLAIIFSIIFIYYIYYIYIGIRRILLIKKHRNIEE